MLDPAVIPTLYFVSVLQLILQAAVAFYAYRITKLTGSFRAWTFIIAAFVLVTMRNVVSLLLSLSLPVDQVTSLIESTGVNTIIVGQVVNITAEVILFLEVAGLVRKFGNQPKSF